MHSLLARLIHLERQQPREVRGHQVTLVAPDGTVLQQIVLLASDHPGGRVRHFTVDGFYATFPDGRITGGVILTDDGRELTPGSLAAAWRDAAIER